MRLRGLSQAPTSRIRRTRIEPVTWGNRRAVPLGHVFIDCGDVDCGDVDSQNLTFRQPRFSCHHQQCMQVLLLMMTVESVQSKRQVFRITAAFFFPLKLFSSHSYGISKLFFVMQFAIR